MNSEFLDKLLSIPSILYYQLSSDGKHIVLSWNKIHENVDVFHINLSKKNAPVALSHTPEMTINVNFYPKSDAVIVAEDIARNERIALYRIDLHEPTKMQRLTQYNPPYFLRGGQVDLSEKWLIYAANYDFDNKKVIEPFWVYKQNLENGEKIPLAKPTKPNFLVPELNKRATHILYNRKELHPKGNQYWLVDVEGEEDREILNFGEKARIEASWLPDSRRIVFMTDHKNGTPQKHYSVGVLDTTNGKIDWLIDDPSRNIEYIKVADYGNKIFVYQAEKARTKTTIIDGGTFEITEFPKVQGNLVPASLDYQNRWIGLYYSSKHPMDIVAFDFDGENITSQVSLTKVWERTELSPEELVQAEDFEWKAHDGLNIHGWLYKPKKWNNKTVVFVHGGPTAHSKDRINPQIQYLVHEGFVVLDPNYRGSTGYSYEFEDKIREHGWGSDEQQDIWKGIEALIEKGLAKPGHVGITGTSYGGYSSWFGITKAPKEIIAAAVPICGMTDLVVDYNTTRPDLRPYSEQMLGGSPEEVPEVYYERSPINFVKNIKGKKLLIVQGAQDPNVTPQNVEEVKKRLDENGIEYELLIFEDEGHGILRTKNQKVLYTRMAEFFKKALE